MQASLTYKTHTYDHQYHPTDREASHAAKHLKSGAQVILVSQTL